MTSRAPRTAWGSMLARWVHGLLPTAAGGPPPAFAALRARLNAWTIGALALGVGAAAGLVLVLVGTAMPHVPASVTGLGVGVLIGAAVALALGSGFPLVRRYGAFAVLLVPLAVAAAPVVLLLFAVPLLWRRPARVVDAPADPLPPVVTTATPRPRRARRKAR